MNYKKAIKYLAIPAIGGAAIIASNIGGFDTTPQTDFSDTVYVKDSQKEQIFDIPDDALFAKVSLTRNDWSEKEFGKILVEVNTEVWNDKMNWGNACGFTTSGGNVIIKNEKTGQYEVSTESFNECELPKGIGRKLKVTVKAKDSFVSTASVEFTTYSPTVMDKISLLFPKIAYAAVTYVQASANGSNCGSVNSCAVTYPGVTTAGNTLISICRYGTNGRTETVSDIQGNTYTLAFEEEQSNDGNGTLRMMYTDTSVGGTTNSTTCTIDGTAQIMRHTVVEITGQDSTSAFDQAAHTEGTGTTGAAGSITPTLSGSMFVGACFVDVAVTVTAGTDFTTRSEVPAAPNTRLYAETYAQATAAAHDTTCTWGASRNWAAGGTVFKPPAPSTAPTGRIIINGQTIINAQTLIQ